MLILQVEKYFKIIIKQSFTLNFSYQATILDDKDGAS